MKQRKCIMGILIAVTARCVMNAMNLRANTKRFCVL